MKTLATLLILIPSICFGATDIIYSAEKKSSAEVIFSDETKTSIQFSLSGLALESVAYEEKNYIKTLPLESEFSEFGYINEEGMPDLPLYSRSIIIPDRSNVRVNIISADYQIIEDVDIVPAQPLQIEGKDEQIPFTRNEKAYSVNEFYPGPLVSAGEPAIFKDFRIAEVTNYPVQYNPVTKEMRVYSNIEYELIYDGFDDRNIKIRNDNFISEAFLPLYRDFLINADEILTDYTPQRGGYLIVSAYSCTTKAKELAEWKHRKGYDVQIISTSDLGGNPTSTQVKNEIQNVYNNSDPQLEYVAIIGDMDGTYGYKVATNDYSGDVSDHQYSLLEGSDYEPDAIVSRLSVRNVTHLNTIIAKTLGYEKDPYMDDPLYLKRGLAVGGPHGSTSPRLVALWVRQTMLDHGFVTADTVIANTNDSYYTNRVTSIINNGVSLVTYRGWGGSSGWSYPSWHTSNIYSLSNGWKIGVMASIVCGTGDFYYTECFNEAWIRVGSETTPKGGLGAFGPTNYWTHTRWNNTIVMGLTSALIERDTYRLGAILIAGKKHAHNSFPHVSGYHGWTWYYHIYNCLGDPELCVRTDIPRSMTATYNSDIPVGTNYLDIHVYGHSLRPLAGAYVCLVKGEGTSEEVFTGGWTDESGNITLDFNTTTPDSMHVTITYRNYIPHQGICQVTSQPTMVAFNDMAIDGDGIANPTETIELAIELKNFGTSVTATNVVGNLFSNNPAAQVIEEAVSYPGIPPGQTCNSIDNFVVHLDGDIPHDETLVFPISVTTDQGTYESCAFVQVKSMKFSHTGHSFPGGGGNLDPGEITDMVINIDNIGDLDGVDLIGVLNCNDPYISIPDDAASFGTINAGGSGSNSDDYFSVYADNAAYDGRNINFILQLTSESGIISTTTFALTLGDVDMYDAIGPDNYGYYMYENIDVGCGDLAPDYNWIEINSIGDHLSFYNSDDASALVELPFDFVYYGETYSHIIVCINGFFAVDTAQTQLGRYHHNWDNYPIPDLSNARAQISPFWDDLMLSTGRVYKYYNSLNSTFIIEWYNLRHSNTNSTETFQVIIYDPSVYLTPTGDAEIVFQYHTIYNNDNNSSNPNIPEAYSSVGFENWDEDDGIQYEWNNIYHPAAATLASGRAIKITTNFEQLVDAGNSSDNLPDEFSLLQNYPNPFNAQTAINYALPEAAHVAIEIFDLLGRKVETLVDGKQPAGYHHVIWNAIDQTSGMYFYKIQTNDFIETKKMVLLK